MIDNLLSKYIMDKNRVVVALVVVVSIVVVAMLYVLFTSSREDVTEEENIQSFEEGYGFDIDNDIDNRKEDEKSVGIIIKNEEVNVDLDKKSDIQKTESKSVTKNTESPETGPGSIAAIIALVLATISAIFVYKKMQQQ